MVGGARTHVPPPLREPGRQLPADPRLPGTPGSRRTDRQTQTDADEKNDRAADGQSSGTILMS